MAIKPTEKTIAAEKKTYFPMLIRYIGKSGYTLVNKPEEIKSGIEFEVVETNFGQ